MDLHQFSFFDDETRAICKLRTLIKRLIMQVGTVMKPEMIEKEMIPELTFREVIKVKQHPNLLKQIEDATRLGNAFQSKVSIIFHDDSGPKRVDTTIWAAGTKFICLKGRVWIPIERIEEIRL